MAVAQTDPTQPSSGFLNTYFSINWVFSPRADLVFLIGSVLTGWAVFALYIFLLGRLPMREVSDWMIIAWFVWVITLDTPHFFATYSRTYMDKEARRDMKPLLILSCGVFLIGPVAMILSYGLEAVNIGFWKAPWWLFLVGVSLWAYWHITRQHYGIMRLYHRKNNEWGTIDAKIDSWVLYGCLLVPFVALIARHPSSRGRVNLDGAVPWFPERAEGQSVFAYLGNLQWEQHVVLGTLIIVGTLLAIFFGRQIYKVLNGQKIALPKILFLAAVLPLHLYMCYSDYLLMTGLLTFTMIITIYHDCQYIAIVWFYNKKRYGGDRKKAIERFGFAAKLSRNLWVYMGFAIMVSIPVWAFGCLINRIPACDRGPYWGEQIMLDTTTWIAFFIILTSGFQMHHYILDQYIWRPGKDKKLREDMGIEETKATPAE